MRFISIEGLDPIEIRHCSDCPFCETYHGGLACGIYRYLYDGMGRHIEDTTMIPNWCELPKSAPIDHDDKQDDIIDEAGHAKYEAI